MKNIISFTLLLFSSLTLFSQSDDSNALELSQDLFLSYRMGHDHSDFKQELENYPLEKLAEELHSDHLKKTFWINLYNVYAQIGLEQHEDLYLESRRKFFKKDFIKVAGQEMSLNDIEHGILRDSRVLWGRGYFRKWFPGKVERTLRVDERDHRIHFALNCGAESCPPISYYEHEKLDDQLNSAAKNFITKTTEYDQTHNTARVSKIFSWYRGDFGGKSGVRDLLKKHEVVPQSSGKIKLEFKEYDWQLKEERDDE